MFPTPRNEARRLAALRDYLPPDSAPDPALTRLVRLTARHFAAPMAAVTIVDEYRVRILAAHGLSLDEVAREDSLCAHTILQRGVMVVPDVRVDDRFGHLVPGTGVDGMRFYAGAPLYTAGGCALGAICVLDYTPREFAPEQQESLADLAAIIMDEFDRRRLAIRLADQTRKNRQSRRTLVRQDRLLRRLGLTREEDVRVFPAESAGATPPSQAELAVLQRAKDNSDKASAAKSDFLLRMSHELRTPLNAILGFGQILQGTVSADTQRMGAMHVVTAGRHLLSLINEVLDIARIEAGRLDLALEPVRVSEIVGEALDLIQPLADGRRIVLEARGGADAGQTVCADRQRLKQVLLNLLSNAVKYSPEEGRVTTCWRVERGEALRISVCDEGPGITREQAARLFVAFERLGAESSDVPGTGLGLALSKSLVEAMHGRIGVHAGAQRGSTFWVRLPLWQEAGHSAVPVISIPPIV